MNRVRLLLAASLVVALGGGGLGAAELVAARFLLRGQPNAGGHALLEPSAGPSAGLGSVGAVVPGQPLGQSFGATFRLVAGPWSEGLQPSGVLPPEPEIQDLDRDGFPDVGDNCPTVFNPGQFDFEADGFGNACDPDYGLTDASERGELPLCTSATELEDWEMGVMMGLAVPGDPPCVEVRLLCSEAEVLEWMQLVMLGLADPNQPACTFETNLPDCVPTLGLMAGGPQCL